MIIEIQFTEDCPNAADIVDLVQALARDRPKIQVHLRAVSEGRPIPNGFSGSPTVLIDGKNPFNAVNVDGPSCALHPPTSSDVEVAIRAAGGDAII